MGRSIRIVLVVVCLVLVVALTGCFDPATLSSPTSVQAPEPAESSVTIFPVVNPDSGEIDGMLILSRSPDYLDVEWFSHPVQ